MTLFHARISGVGAYLPPKIITNEDLSKTVNTNDEWIVSRTGIRTRHVVENETCADLAFEASKAAITNAGLSFSDLDCVVVGTVTPDKIFPSVATMVTEKMGIAVPAYDVAAACSGFVFALNTAHNMIQVGQADRTLVIGADVYSRMLDWTDRNTCVLFGDGAGAVVLEKSDTPHVLSTHIYANGAYGSQLQTKSCPNAPDDSIRGIDMDGRNVYKFAVSTMVESVEKALHHNNLSLDDVDWVVPHQANLRIITTMASQLNVDMDKVIVSLENHANISAATVPVAITQAVTQGKFKRGDIVVLTTMGAGFTWGASVIKW